MGQAPFLDTSSIEFSYSKSRFQKIFPHPMNQISCKWMAKSMKALSEETSRLAFNERDIYIYIYIYIYIFKTFAFTQEFKGYS